MDSYLSWVCKCYVKCKQPCPGFEFVSSCTFLKPANIAPCTPLDIYIYIYREREREREKEGETKRGKLSSIQTDIYRFIAIDFVK